MPDEPLPVIFHDDWLIAINKPCGLLVHRSPIDRRETRFALQLLRDQVGRRVYPVHRLDKPTSGVLLFAFDSSTAAALSRQFEQRRVSKRYLAIVRGWTPEAGTIDHALREDADRLAGIERGPAKEARSHFQRLAKVELPIAVDRYPQTRYSLVALQPESGRKHQLRRHMKHIGHPILGDAKHGKGVHNRFIAARYGVSRLLLSCIGLELLHPHHSGELLSLEAAPGSDFSALCDQFGWQAALKTATQHQGPKHSPELTDSPGPANNPELAPL